MAGIRLRLRAPAGQSTITLADDATITDLISRIIEKTSVSKFDVKYGYPPRPLLLDQHEKSTPLSKLEVKLNGEQLTISPKEDTIALETASKSLGNAESHKASKDTSSFSFSGDAPAATGKLSKPIALKKKVMGGDVPEIPLPNRGATLGELECPI